MAKNAKKREGKVEKVMHEYKEGSLKSGPEGKGGKVTTRKQAVAIALSEAREAGEHVSPPKSKNKNIISSVKDSIAKKSDTKKTPSDAIGSTTNGKASSKKSVAKQKSRL